MMSENAAEKSRIEPCEEFGSHLRGEHAALARAAAVDLPHAFDRHSGTCRCGHGPLTASEWVAHYKAQRTPVIHEPRCNTHCTPGAHHLTSGVGYPHLHRTDLANECAECLTPPGSTGETGGQR